VDINPLAEFIASFLRWFLGAVLLGSIIFILFKMNIITINPGISKGKMLKSEIESSFMDNIVLPPDIIQNAQREWSKKNITAALSLLYRGAIFYIINVKKIGIPDYTTEKENLSTVYQKLKGKEDAALLLDDFSILTSQWQRCAYGDRFPDDTTFMRLCNTWKYYFIEMGRP
jgi:hypothetical protein